MRMKNWTVLFSRAGEGSLWEHAYSRCQTPMQNNVFATCFAWDIFYYQFICTCQRDVDGDHECKHKFKCSESRLSLLCQESWTTFMPFSLPFSWPMLVFSFQLHQPCLLGVIFSSHPSSSSSPCFSTYSSLSYGPHLGEIEHLPVCLQRCNQNTGEFLTLHPDLGLYSTRAITPWVDRARHFLESLHVYFWWPLFQLVYWLFKLFPYLWFPPRASNNLSPLAALRPSSWFLV